ncbi:MAG: alpha/beta hydrolase [Acidobacteria bacterium]|nr:alpha/beta hydrolase [Acidobacteriota bacterium]MXZ73367.1 alpha/beta hydrolase [Acidobacteriota bacterium]MYD69557.1 alpha/beta hydrolase [Acidobacteriota bacterium]MYJ05228.1 alpha/beta hydrolase [Acidobacteriota bacterium]
MTSRSLVVACVLAVVALAGAPSDADAQLGQTETWASHVSNEYRVVPNVTYHVANGFENRVDLYLPRNSPGPSPVLMYIHGGGWVGGSKEANVLRLLPWLEMGWAVVNVQYRLGRVSRAPAAVEDCLCALHWVKANADDYGFDANRIVVTGNSAGGHLALTTGMIPGSSGLDLECQPRGELGVAAIINWYGITDVGDLLAGANEKSYAVRWMGSLADRMDVAERVSPLSYVRSGLPPTLTIHGDADGIVPHQHAVRLHEALSGAGVSNELHTVPGGGHGGFSRDETIAIFETIHRFLGQHGLGGAQATTEGQP